MIDLFPPGDPILRSKLEKPEKPEPDSLEAWIVCAMVQNFLVHWDAIYPDLIVCRYPDQHGSLDLWDNHFVGEPPREQHG